MPTYGPTPTAPTVTEGFFVKAESRVLLGTSEKYGALDKTSVSYTTYTISVGLSAGNFIDMGFVESLGYSYVQTWEAVDSANVAQGRVYDMTGEELTVSVGIREFKKETLQAALNSGVMYTLGTEVLYAFGGGCTLINRPVAIEFSNQACDAPTSPTIVSGITGGVLTAYDTICTSGLPWDAMVRGEMNLLSLEFKGRPILERTKGQRFGSLWIY